MKARLLLVLFLVSNNFILGQGRNYIKEKIEVWGECKNVAITLTGGDIALYGKNGWAGTGLPSSMINALNELNEENELIDDVQLTESGSWLILYGLNGIRWDGIPFSLEERLREMNSNKEIITSVTFNDSGEWIVISTEHIAASSTNIYSWIEDGLSSYGQLWAAHLTNDGVALCYANGYKFFGNVPYKLKQKLKETKIDVYRIKFLSDGAYFIADRNGRYAYFL